MDLRNIREKLLQVFTSLDKLTVQGSSNCIIVGTVVQTISEIGQEIDKELENDDSK